MNEEINNLESELKAVIESLKNELSSIRGNRPTSKLVEDIKVEYFDKKLPLKQLASIAVVPPREIQITVWDKSAAIAVAKAIDTANIGISANVQGNLIRINLPPLSEERRQELIKLIKSMTENYRIRIRKMREGYNKKIRQAEDDKKIGKDEKFKFQEQVQVLIDTINKEVEVLLDNKIKELQE